MREMWSPEAKAIPEMTEAQIARIASVVAATLGAAR